MPSKILTFCYVHDCTERPTRDYNIKEITGIVKLSETDPTKITFLRIKAFVPINQDIESKIDPTLETGNTILLKGKFVPFENYYIVRSYSDVDFLKDEKNLLTILHLPYFSPQQGQRYFH